MKYKVGDKVKVKPLSWFKENCGRTHLGGYSKLGEKPTLSTHMKEYCGKTVTIDAILEQGYCIKESAFSWQDWMFEDVEFEEVLIPFDVEKAKAGAEVVTKKGCSVRILCYDRKSECYPIVALVNDGGKESNNSFTIDGFYHSNKSDCLENLLIKEYRPKQRTEFTMQEIADKLGVDVNELKIKK